MIELKQLIQHGVHFGHQTSRWFPKMRPYIWGHKNNIHLIDISKTAIQLEKAAQFLKSVAASNKSILFVGTKKAAKEQINRLAGQINVPYVTERWIGGLLTNRIQVQKAVKNYQNYTEILSKSDQYHYTKKELSVFQKRLDRLEKNVGGIQNLTWPLGAIVIIDVKKEHVAVKEAQAMGIPIVALVDTNCDPTGIDYVIPANDDAPRSISLLLSYLAEAIQQGQTEAKTQEEAVESDKVKADRPEEKKEKKITKKTARAKNVKSTDEDSVEQQDLKAHKSKESARSSKPVDDKEENVDKPSAHRSVEKETK